MVAACAAELAERVLEVEHRVVVEVLARLSASMTAASPAPTRARRPLREAL